MTSQLRLVVFSPSIISDFGNPLATTVRAICQAFIGAGHDVTHLEERGNPFLQEMLRLRGYAPMRAFNERYSLIRYRQYTVTGGWERVVWFGREIGTADVVVAYPGVPHAIVDEVAAISSPRIVTFWPGADGEQRELLPLWFDPAVLPRHNERPRRDDLVVAYDNEVPVPDGPSARLSLGRFSGIGWVETSEVEAEARYRQAVSVVMRDEHESTDTLARALLPVANGATVRMVDDAGNVTRTLMDVPAANDARARSDRLAKEIDRILDGRQAELA